MRVKLEKFLFIFIFFGFSGIGQISGASPHDHQSETAKDYSQVLDLPEPSLNFSGLMSCMSYLDQSHRRQHRAKEADFFTGPEQIFTMLVNEAILYENFVLDPMTSPSVLSYLHGLRNTNEDFYRFVYVSGGQHQCVKVPNSSFNIEIDTTGFGIQRILALGSFLGNGLGGPQYVLNFRSIKADNKLDLPIMTSWSPQQVINDIRGYNFDSDDALYLRPTPSESQCDDSPEDRIVQELMSVQIISQMIAVYSQAKLEHLRSAIGTPRSSEYNMAVEEFAQEVLTCTREIEQQKLDVDRRQKAYRMGLEYNLLPLSEDLESQIREMEFIHGELSRL